MPGFFGRRRRRQRRAQQAVQQYAIDGINALGPDATNESVTRYVRQRIEGDAGRDRPLLNLLAMAFKWLKDSGLLDALIKAWVGSLVPSSPQVLNSTSEFGAGILEGEEEPGSEAADAFLDDGEINEIFSTA